MDGSAPAPGPGGAAPAVLDRLVRRDLVLLHLETLRRPAGARRGRRGARQPLTRSTR
jgi:hypothetical protein